MNMIIKKILLINQISLLNYIYLNYFNKNVIHKGQGKIIPYKNTCIDFAKNSKLYIYDNNLEIGTNKLKKSHMETYIRFREGAIWCVKKGANISYGTTIEILQNAYLDTDFFTINSFSTIVCSKKIVIGDNVMIGRNVIIYDSDFHRIIDEDKCQINKSEFITIKDNVWVGTNSIILKNVFINKGMIISAGTLVTDSIFDECKIFFNKRVNRCNDNKVYWVR